MAGASRHIMAMNPTRRTSLALLATLVLAGCAPGAGAPRAGRAVAGVTPSQALEARELTMDQQVRHVLNRLGFGPRPGDVAAVRAMGVDEWIARQLEPRRIEDPAVEKILTRYQTIHLDASDLLREYPSPQQVRAMRRGRDTVLTREDSLALRRARQNAERVLLELQSAKVARAVMSERQLEEVMVDFWENHFNVFAGKGPTRYFMAEYDRDVIRPRALGRFRDLLGAVAKSPAMLYYLDNYQSAADSAHPTLADARRPAVRRGRAMPPMRRPPQRRRRGLNENYARELLELHTLGVDGGYTQQDIIAVARAFTGWTIDDPRRGGGFVFRPGMHDAGEKRVLGTRLRAGRGIEDGEQVLDLVARHPSTARFIAEKLARRFVSDSPPPALVARAAETFTRTDGDVREVVRTIVTSPEFFSSAAYKSKVKSPFEVVVSALRALGAEPDPTPRTARLVARLGQPLYGRQSPDGWPETGAEWINTGAILNRINFGMALAANRVPGARLEGWPAFESLAGAPREAQVDGVVAALFGGEISPEMRAVLLSGDHPMLAAAAAAPDSVAAPPERRPVAGEEPDEMMMAPEGPRPGEGPRRARARRGDDVGALPALEGLAQVMGLALGAPEFQRR
jgi:uncharacterized protein (DUF1800 family)